MVVMILSFVNCLLFAYLLIVHLRQHKAQQTPCCRIMMKVKTSVLILLLAFETIVFFRYTMGFDLLYDFLLILSQFIQAIILFQTSYFFIKKASFYIDENEKIRKLMRIVIYISLVVFASIGIWQLIFDEIKHK